MVKSRKTKVYVKEKDKDEEYYIRRKRNTEYARRSRRKKAALEELREKIYNQLVKDLEKIKKSHQKEIQNFKSNICKIEEENEKLKLELSLMEEENEKLRIELLKTENLSLFPFDINDNSNFF